MNLLWHPALFRLLPALPGSSRVPEFWATTQVTLSVPLGLGWGGLGYEWPRSVWGWALGTKFLEPCKSWATCVAHRASLQGPPPPRSRQAFGIPLLCRACVTLGRGPGAVREDKARSRWRSRHSHRDYNLRHQVEAQPRRALGILRREWSAQGREGSWGLFGQEVTSIVGVLFCFCFAIFIVWNVFGWNRYH